MQKGPLQRYRQMVQAGELAPDTAQDWRSKSCHIALDASGKQGSRKIMFGVAEAIHYRVTENRLTHAHSRDAQD